MAICITGMGRSGTSLVAKVLHECGLFLGPERNLLPPNSGNRDGYWESAEIVAINDEILRALGGAWNQPPRPPDGWETDVELEPLRERARQLVAAWSRHTPWGWKDPRSALTLPFWKRIVDDLEVVVCVRHPAEVARSLEARDSMPQAAAIDLWLTYNSLLIDGIDSGQYVVTHYGSFFADPKAEIQRLAQRVGLRPSGLQVARALASVNGDLRNHVAGARSVADDDLPPSVLTCYEQLCAAEESVSARDGHGADGAGAEVELRAVRELLAETRSRIYELQDAVEERTGQLREAEAISARVAELEAADANAQRTLQAQATSIAELETTVQTLHESRSFRYTAPFRRLASLLRESDRASDDG